MAEDEAARALSTMAKADYALMPVRAGSSLSDLEEAWRNPSSVGVAASEPRRKAAQASPSPTGESSAQVRSADGIVVHTDVPPQRPPQSRAMLAVVAAAVVALVGAGAGLA